MMQNITEELRKLMEQLDSILDLNADWQSVYGREWGNDEAC